MTAANRGSYGPLWRINGPLPEPPKYTLLKAATIVDDIDAAQVERWINGVKVYPYPCNLPDVWEACASAPQNKQTGVAVPLPEFSAFTVILGENCASYAIAGPNMTPAQIQERFFDRVSRSFTAVEAFAVEAEFMYGALLGATTDAVNAFLADGAGTFPYGNVATSVVNAFAVLENEIAKSGKRGMIHCSPALATAAIQGLLLWEDPREPGKLQTRLGTIVVPGGGYINKTGHPVGSPLPSTTLQEWIYATGMVEIRRSELVQLPENFEQALNRGTNTVTYAAERYYVVDWDTCVHAAVLADRCATTCGTPPT